MNDAAEDGAPREALSFPHLMKWAEMAVRARVEKAMRAVPVTSAQLFALVLLEEGDATAAQLGRKMFLTPQTMTTVLRPLRDQRLIEQRVDEHHRRQMPLSLTEEGRRLLDRARAMTPQIEADVLAEFSAEERATLTRLLTRIVRAGDR